MTSSPPPFYKGFVLYKRKGQVFARPYVPGEIFSSKVSISEADRNNGSPKLGDMIAKNPKNPDDQWLIAEAYFKENYEFPPR